MSPGQARGKPVDKRADILGVWSGYCGDAHGAEGFRRRRRINYVVLRAPERARLDSPAVRRTAGASGLSPSLSREGREGTSARHCRRPSGDVGCLRQRGGHVYCSPRRVGASWLATGLSASAWHTGHREPVVRSCCVADDAAGDASGDALSGVSRSGGFAARIREVARSGSLRHRPHRRRRHGVGLSGDRHRTRPRRAREDPARGVHIRPRSPGALRARSEGPRFAEPPQRRS